MLRGRELGRQSKSRIFGIFVSCRLSLVDLGPPHAPYPCFMAASASVLGLFQRPLMLFARWLEQMPLPLCSPGQSAVGRPLNANVYFRGFCVLRSFRQIPAAHVRLRPVCHGLCCYIGLLYCNSNPPIDFTRDAILPR